MESLENIQLIPVIALLPVDLGESYPYPSTKEERYQHWKKVISKFGIGQLEPIELGYDFVKTSDINNLALEKLMLMALNGIETGNENLEIDEIESKNMDEEDLPTSFEGGIVMLCNEKVFLTPQCCVSLQDHQEWFETLGSNPFGMIWIGHPWVCYLQQGDNVLLTSLIEKDFFKEEWRFYHPSKNNDLTTFQYSDSRYTNKIESTDFKYSISKNHLEIALEELRQELHNFKIRLIKIGKKLGFENPEIIAQCLISGNGEELSYDKDNNKVRLKK